MAAATACQAQAASIAIMRSVLALEFRLADFPPSDSSPGPTYRHGDEGAAPVLDLHSACRTLSTDALSRKRGGSRSLFLPSVLLMPLHNQCLPRLYVA